MTGLFINEDGFSLVELLVALAILSLMFAMASGGLTFGARVWERTYAGSDATEDLVLVDRFLRRTISSIYPYMVDVDFKTRYVDFSGEAQRMRFIGPALPQMQHTGLTRYEIGGRAADGGQKLVLRWCPIDSCRSEADFLNHASEVDILDDTGAVAFRYGANDGIGDDWQMSWTRRERLPDRIQVSFDRDDTRGGAWPVLVASPRVDQDARCVFDPISKKCRGR